MGIEAGRQYSGKVRYNIIQEYFYLLLTKTWTLYIILKNIEEATLAVLNQSFVNFMVHRKALDVCFCQKCYDMPNAHHLLRATSINDICSLVFKILSLITITSLSWIYCMCQ